MALVSLASASLVAAALLGPWVLQPAREGWGRLWHAGSGRPVLVIVVGDAAAVARLRAGVAPERVIAASDDAFALHESRVVAASLEAAGPILTEAGLGGRRIEIWSASGMRALDPLRPTAGMAGTPQGLASRPTLTLGEALMLLNGDLP